MKDGDGGAASNTITIDPNGAETIDKVATIDIDAAYVSLSFFSDGAEWRIV